MYFKQMRIEKRTKSKNKLLEKRIPHCGNKKYIQKKRKIAFHKK